MRALSIPIFAVLLFAAGIPAVKAAAAPPRERILMDADWKFFRGEIETAPAAPQGTQITHWRWMNDDTGMADAAKMADPALDASAGDWKDAASGDDVFKGRVGFAWFRTTLPEGAKTHTIHFDCVDDNATVYLNGQRLVRHEGWDDPFDVDLAPAWKKGGPNLLAVLVENTAGAGGITAPVYLLDPGTSVAGGPPSPGFPDRSWRTVHLPHDFIIEGTFSELGDASHGSLPTTTGWYRKTFNLPAADKGKSLWIDFDGVYRDSKVWLNGHYLGHHTSGYTSFRFDITPYAKCGGRNVLAVHVDPRHFEGWWYEGGGIYRHVWLNVAEPVHFAPWGTFVTSNLPEPGPDGSAASATLTIKTSASNATAVDATRTLVSQVLDAAGQPVAEIGASVTVPAGKSVETTQSATVTNPHLWSIEKPYLYHLVTTLRSNDRVMDREETSFGIRTIRYDADKGFFLNGKSVKIKGTCNHQDFVAVGVGVPDSLEAWRVQKLKDMGGNGWRMSHNPPTPGLLDACDRLGMLVMDENRHVGDSDANLAEVASMVLRDRNHPSVIMWSMCNEEGRYQGTDEGAKIFSHMMDTVHQYDTTRPISCAQSDTRTWGHGFSLVEDLQGCNYGGGGDYDRVHGMLPNKPVFGSETASTLTTRGAYANDAAHVLVSSYNMTDSSWKNVADREFMCGSFVWTGFDYKGEPTPYKWPCVNSNFGILDMCGFPKDNYWYYLSWWKSEPVVHLMPHWNWPGREGQPVRVIAFSNCSEVEVFLNGQSMGRKPMPRYEHLQWMVPYAPGTLSAKGYDSTGAETASTKVETTGGPASLRLSTERTSLASDSEDLAPVKVEVLDAQGRVVPTADDLVTFKVAGAGFVAGVGNGNPGDHDPDRGSTRHAFNGLCMVVVGSTDKPGVIQLTATSPGLRDASLSLTAVAP